MKNIDIINKIISNKLDISHDIVKKINKIYWSEVKRKFSTLESANLYIRNLGTFTSSRYLNNKLIKETIFKIRYLNNLEKTNTVIKKLNTLNNRLKKLVYQRNEIAKIYYVKPN